LNPLPMVTCVMLTRNREQMALRAIECFKAQTWRRKRLIVVDDSDEPSIRLLRACDQVHPLCYRRMMQPGAHSVGELRRFAVRLAETEWPVESGEDILAHWDDDDWSGPRRLGHQMYALSRTLLAGVAAFDRMLFYDQPRHQAWEYRGGPIGASLMYPLRLALEYPFDDGPGAGEDTRWLSRLRVARVPIITEPAERHMVAGIHRLNHTSAAYDAERMEANPQHWTRQPDQDDWCRQTFGL